MKELMDNIREFPCCLCPAAYSDFQKNVCSDCDFVKKFTDERGWIYFVRKGIGDTVYKAFYKKPDSNKEKGCIMVKWQPSFTHAQIDLNVLAKKKNWKEVRNVSLA